MDAPEHSGGKLFQSNTGVSKCDLNFDVLPAFCLLSRRCFSLLRLPPLVVLSNDSAF